MFICNCMIDMPICEVLSLVFALLVSFFPLELFMNWWKGIFRLSKPFLIVFDTITQSANWGMRYIKHQYMVLRMTQLLCMYAWYELILTHWGRVTHICVGNLTIIGSDNGLSPGRRQAIIWTNAGIILFGPLGTNVSEIVIKVQTFSFKKMHFKMSPGKWRPSCLDPNVLNPLS